MSQQNPWVYLLMVYRCAVTLFIHFVDCGFGSLDNRMQHVKSTQPYFQNVFRITNSVHNYI